MKGKMTVSHAKFQYYRHNYCLVCMTGLLGCRWHRYQQSTRDNRKRDIFWFSLFTLTFLYITFFFYFWFIGENDFNNMEWFLFKRLKVWIPWYRILLPVTGAVFGYFLLVMILYLCHIGHGHQIFIHMSHIVFIILSLMGCVFFTIILDELWNEQFHVVYLSLQMFGPFLHIGVVVIMTALMWFISHSWYKLSSKLFQLLWLIALVGGMVGLYIAPLYIQCPCVTSSSSMPPRPKFFAHKGAEAVSPENTMISFQKAIEYGAFGLESDVRLSYDGVPFICHDSTFLRTTNIREIFPDRSGQDVSLFNISDIKRLNAGRWFFDKDPFHTAGGVSDKDRAIYNNQSILLLSELLNISAEADTVLMFDMLEPVDENPFRSNFTQLVTETLLASNMNMSKLYWLRDEGKEPRKPPPGSLVVYGGGPSVYDLEALNITAVNSRYDKVNADRIKSYVENNITSNIFVVDSDWFYSYYWCLGASSVTTRRIDLMSQITAPIWTLGDTSYLILWVAVDVVSAILVIVIFVVQRIRLFGTSFSPESVSLTSARRARTYRSRTMKEKLLREGIIDPMDDPDGQGVGVVNQPAAYSMSSLPASNSFTGGTSSARVAPISQPDQKYEVE